VDDALTAFSRGGAKRAAARVTCTGGHTVDKDTQQVRLCDLRMNSCRWPSGGRWEHVEF